MSNKVKTLDCTVQLLNNPFILNVLPKVLNKRYPLDTTAFTPNPRDLLEVGKAYDARVIFIERQLNSKVKALIPYKIILGKDVYFTNTRNFNKEFETHLTENDRKIY